MSWETATEIDNDFFTIERSANGVDYTIVAIVNGAGNSNSTLNYEKLDITAPAGTSLYRLKQTDFDGRFTYSDVISLTRSASSEGIIAISPVPTFDNLNVSIVSAEPRVVTLNIFDIAGKLVMSSTHNVVAETNQVTLNVQQLSVGTYFINVDGKTSHKFIKE